MKLFTRFTGTLSTPILLALSISACDSHPSQQWKIGAPQSDQEIGLIVTGVERSKIENWITDHPKSSAREVSGPHQIFELHNTTIAELKADFQTDQVYRNEFIPASSFTNQPEELLKNNWAEFKINKSGVVDPNSAFITCVRGPESPQPIVTAVTPIAQLNQGTVKFGETIGLSSNQSYAHPQHLGELKRTWLMIPPRGSQIGHKGFSGVDFEFKPDSVGLYQLGLLIQDSRDVCSFLSFGVVVTHNPGFKSPEHNLLELRNQHNLDGFKHLTELGTVESWETSEGEGQIIAIVDTGVNYNHLALSHNILVNADEIPGNGVDDDNNGYIDDHVGFDFANGDSDPFDDDGHGSHVAGLAASSVFGAARAAKILSVKALGPRGGDQASVAASILYAVDRGASVINLSLSGAAKVNPIMDQAMKYAENHNVLVVISSGNGDSEGKPVDIDVSPAYPAAMVNSNIISVAAKDSVGLLAPYSNYGINSVDIIAPGGGLTKDDKINSCTTQNNRQQEYVGMMGTSMAAPIVSGIAAQVRAINPSLTPEKIRELLMKSGKLNEELAPYAKSSRYLSGIEAIQSAVASSALNVDAFSDSH